MLEGSEFKSMHRLKYLLKNPIFLAVCCIILILGSLTSVMQATVSGSTITQHTLNLQGTIVQQQPYSYIIYQQNATYYAKNETSGQISWSSSNCSEVINSAIATTTNGVILVKAGTYDLGSTNGGIPSITISGKSNVILMAESGVTLQKTANILLYINNCHNITIDGFIFNFTRHEGSTAIYVNGTNTNLHITNNQFDISGTQVVSSDLIYPNQVTQSTNGFWFSGNTIYQADVDALDIVGITNAWVENNKFLNFTWAGIYMMFSAIQTVSNIHISGNLIIGCSSGNSVNIGVELQPSDNGDRGKDIFVDYNQIYNVTKGIGFYGVLNNTRINGNTINLEQSNSVVNSNGILVQGVWGGLHGTGVDISNNIVQKTGSYGIVTYYLNSSTIVNNKISNTYDSGLVTAYSNFMQIQTNKINKTAAYGIQVYSNCYSEISDNTINYANNYGGIALQGSPNNNNIVSNNTITNGTSYGILVSSGANNQILNNTLVSNAGTEIADAGTGTIISDPDMNPKNLGNLSVLGNPITITVNQAVSFGNPLFQNNTGRYLASATSNATMPVSAMAIQTTSSDTNCRVITNGYIRDDTWSWTAGTILYASTLTGQITQTHPNASGNVIQQIGTAVTSNIIYFSNNYS